MVHLDTPALEAGLEGLRAAPADDGRIELIVRRPEKSARELLAAASLDVVVGLVGDNWKVRGSSRTPDGAAKPDCQLTLMNARAAALIAGPIERWPLAGDQLYVDLDLSHTNLPAGTRLALGTAVIEVTPEPHTGCAKFIQRFGRDAMKFVNSPAGLELRARGMNTKVVVAGTVAVGDVVRKVPLPVAAS